MKTKEEIKKWLLENCVNQYGNLDLTGLDFSDFDGNVYTFGMNVKKNLDQGFQEVGGNLDQSAQKVKGNLDQSFQYVDGILLQGANRVKSDGYTKPTRKKKPSKEEIKKWLLENCVDKNGNLDLSGLDFSDFDGSVDISGMKVKKNLLQNKQQVEGCLYQRDQRVRFDLDQPCQQVERDLDQHGQDVGGDLMQNSNDVFGNVYQGDQNVAGTLYQDMQRDDISNYHKRAPIANEVEDCLGCPVEKLPICLGEANKLPTIYVFDDSMKGMSEVESVEFRNGIGRIYLRSETVVKTVVPLADLKFLRADEYGLTWAKHADDWEFATDYYRKRKLSMIAKERKK